MFLSSKKLRNAVIPTAIAGFLLSGGALACDKWVSMDNKGDILVMTSGSPYDCPAINDEAMVRSACDQNTRPQSPEGEQWKRACKRYWDDVEAKKDNDDESIFNSLF